MNTDDNPHAAIEPASAGNGGRQPCRVALVEDHTLMREGMKAFIETIPGFRWVWSAASAQEAIAKLDQTVPDLMLMDITLPDRNGLEIVKDLRATHPEIKILMLSMHDENLYAPRALKAGARGYVMKSAPHDAIKAAIIRVAEGGIAVSPMMSERILAEYSSGNKLRGEAGLQTLTDRELEVYQLTGEGQNTGQVAETLGISTKTVDVHKMNIRAKLGIRDGGDLTVQAVRWVEARNRGTEV